MNKDYYPAIAISVYCFITAIFLRWKVSKQLKKMVFDPTENVWTRLNTLTYDDGAIMLSLTISDQKDRMGLVMEFDLTYTNYRTAVTSFRNAQADLLITKTLN